MVRALDREKEAQLNRLYEASLYRASELSMLLGLDSIQGRELVTWYLKTTVAEVASEWYAQQWLMGGRDPCWVSGVEGIV